MGKLDHLRLMQLNKPLPRYTSYPTAPEWEAVDEELYKSSLQTLGENTPLSLYVHIPFCKTMCLYCACSVVLNRRVEREERYVRALAQEMNLIAGLIKTGPPVRQLHFGGGTPTQLSEGLLGQLMESLRAFFQIDDEGEISIEIDPRTVLSDEGAKLRFLQSVGFNRVSFGVQDTNQRVQEAVKRRQSCEMTTKTYELARSLGFRSVNVDLIYGLPFQTVETFQDTAEQICALKPDRIALFSYARVPWLKPHQKAIKDETLPGAAEKFAIYCAAREQFLGAGYVQIGMDHFALPDDPLAKAYRKQQLQRNFQGYSLKVAEHLIGLGMTATGFVNGCYFQNAKTLDGYYEAIDQGQLPIFRGKRLTEDDQIRKWVIHRLMCNFSLSKREFFKTFSLDFDDYFAKEKPQLDSLVREGLLEHADAERLSTTLYGKLLIRNVASTFDAYLQKPSMRPIFSQSI